MVEEMQKDKFLIDTKRGKMTRYNAWKYFFDSRDFDFLEHILHEDFMLIEEYSMITKLDAIKYFGELVEAGWNPSNGKVAAESKNSITVEYNFEQNGKLSQHTMVQLWKDGKVWREIDLEEEVNP